MMLFRFLNVMLFLLMASVAHADVSFVHDIAPIVLKRCAGCHGEKANLGGYRANTFAFLMKVGASGKAPVVPGKPAESVLYQRIIAQAEDIRMPQSDDPLTAEQIDLIRKWIFAGAKFDGPDPVAPLKNLMGPRVHPTPPAVYRTAEPVMALAFAPGGKQIAVGGYNEVLLYDLATGTVVRRIPHLPQRIQALAFRPDGKQLLVGGGTPGEYGEVTVVNLDAKTPPRVLDTCNDIVLAASFSPDGKLIVAGGADASVRCFEATDGKRLWTSKVHADWVTSVSVSFDGQFVASASRDRTVKVYEAATGTLYTTYNGHTRQIGEHKDQSPIYSVRFAPDSLTAYSAGGGKWIQLWDPLKAKQESGDGGDMEERFAKQRHTRYITHGFTKDVYALAVRDGQVFAASADGILKQFDLATMQEVRAFSGGKDWLFSLDYDATSQRIAAGSFDGDVHVWDARTGKPILTFRVQPGVQAKPRTSAIATR